MAVPVIEAVIFDCFGVLYTDSKRSLLDIVPTSRRQELSDLFTSNNYGYFDRPSYVRQVADIVQISTQQVEAYIAHEHHINQRLVDYITERLRPQYRIGLLSNIGRGWIDDFFDEHQLHDLFDEIILSGEEGITKPHPAIFELMADRLSLPAGACVMIDDIEENCQGATIAGMQAVHFQNTPQAIHDLKLLLGNALT